MPQTRLEKTYRRSRRKVKRLEDKLLCAKMSRAYYRQRARKAQTRLEHVEKKYRRRRKQVAKLKQKTEAVKARADSSGARAKLKRLNAGLSRQRDKLARHRARLERVEKKLDRRRQRVKQDNARLRRLKRKLDRLREKMTSHHTRLRREKKRARQQQEASEHLAVTSSASEEPVSQVEAGAAVSAAQEEPTGAAVSAAQEEPTDDDLKKVEGIGPKIEGLCHEAGITSFAQLAATPVSELQAILDRAGTRYRIHNPTTWPQQATLLAEGRWDEIKELQDRLIGGRPPSEDAQV